MPETAAVPIQGDLDDALTDDAFFSGRLAILQPKTGFRAGLDSVVLAAAIAAKPGERILELGTGPGVASLCVADRLAGVTITGLEIQPDVAALARRNADRNGFADRIRILDGDVAAPPPDLSNEEFDQALFNPHYGFAHEGTHPPDPGKARAHVLTGSEATLEDWIACALTHLRHKGRLTLVHRADKLDELLVLLNGRAGGIVVFPLWPGPGRTAKRLLVSARKGVATPLTLKAGLELFDAKGEKTAMIDAIARNGAALDILSR